MSTANRLVISAITGVAGTAGIGFWIGGGLVGAFVGAAGFAVPVAVVSSLSQCSYRFAKRFRSDVATPIAAAGITSVTTGMAVLRAAEVVIGRGISTGPALCDRYNSSTSCFATYAVTSAALIGPISMAAVAMDNYYSKDVIANVRGNAARQEHKQIAAPIEVKSEIGQGALTGLLAGSLAQLSVGFKEGPIGGLLGGAVDKSISYHLQKKGVAKLPAEVAAFAMTALVDIGGLHFFGSERDCAPISYALSEDMTMHHLVFYSLLLMGMLDIPATYKALNNRLGFFSRQPVAENKEVVQAARENKEVAPSAPALSPRQFQPAG